MKILLLQDDPEVREKVVFVLDATFAAEVVEAEVYQQAAPILQAKNPGLDFVVCDVRTGSSKDLDDFLTTYKSVPSFVCVDGTSNRRAKLSWNVLGFVSRDSIIENLVAAIRKHVQGGNLRQVEDEREYCKIRTRLLLSVFPLKGDIYIRLSESKFVKLFHQGDQFDVSDMEKYTVKKGIEYLFLKKDQVGEFVQKYQRDLEKQLSAVPALTIEQLANQNDLAYETVRELGRSLGFTKEVQNLAKTHVQMAVKSLGDSPKLSQILRRLEQYKGQYISSHSAMTGYLACAIASQMKWGSESTFQKLSLASFLHDIALESETLAECESIEDAKKGGFSEAEIKEFEEHPGKAAAIAQAFTEVPPDVDVIIAQHHERPDGKGFPRHLTSAYISPLAAVFIVAHDMAKYMLKEKREMSAQSLKLFLEQAKGRYQSSQFRKVIQAIELLQP